MSTTIYEFECPNAPDAHLFVDTIRTVLDAKYHHIAAFTATRSTGSLLPMKLYIQADIHKRRVAQATIQSMRDFAAGAAHVLSAVWNLRPFPKKTAQRIFAELNQ